MDKRMPITFEIKHRTTGGIITDHPMLLVDESLGIIKAKLFAAMQGIDMYPGFLKFELQVGADQTYVLLPDNKPIVQYLQDLQAPITLYITNLLTVLETQYDIGTLMTLDNTEELYKTLQMQFVDTTEKDLEFAIKLITFKTNPVVHADLQPFIEEYIQTIRIKQQATQQKLSVMQGGLQQLYDTLPAYTDIRLFLDTADNGQIDYKYSSVALSVRGKGYVPGVKGFFVKLESIFNVFPLSETIPFIAYKIPGNDTEPMVKVFDKLAKSEDARTIRSWIFSEKKKMNLVSYKKVRGMLLKYKLSPGVYIDIHLFRNGLLEVKLAADTLPGTLETILQTILGSLNTVIDSLNMVQGGFTQARHLDSVANSTLELDAITCSVNTTFRISQTKLMNVLTNKALSDYIFEQKDTITENVLSLFYKKSIYSDSSDEDTGKKGITVTVRDNPYTLDSSVITIFSASSRAQIQAILIQLIALAQVDIGQVESLMGDEDQKLKTKSHIKALRKQGVKMLSTKCQKPRQPVVSSDSASQTYTLQFKGKSYVCPTKEYPYPGFTNENIVCCFKKDQRQRETYIRNSKHISTTADDILVEPSNTLVQIQDKNNQVFTTFILKIASEYVPGMSSANAMSQYYYHAFDNTLVAITNNDLIEQLASEQYRDMWLPAIPLQQLLNPQQSKKCTHPPDMAQRDRSLSDVNAPCRMYPKHKFSGFTPTGVPCCFTKARETVPKKPTESKKQHIITSDKMLEYKRLGTLPSVLNTVLNEIIDKPDNSIFYRMGVVQNNAAFLNAILLALNNTIQDRTINTSSQFKQYIFEHVNKPDVFRSLNSGALSIAYPTVESYIQSVNDSIDWIEVVDVVQRLVQVNVLVLDIPYKTSESTTIPDYSRMTLVCTPHVRVQEGRDYIVLLKRMTTFEIIVLVHNDGGIQSVFHPETSIIKLLLDYKADSCVKQDIFPDGFTFTKLYTVQELLTTLQDTPHTITSQIITAFNKVVYLKTKSGAVLPVVEAGIQPNLPTHIVIDIVRSQKLPTLAALIATLQDINTYFPQDKQCALIGVTLANRETTTVTAVLTNMGQLVPVKQSPLQGVSLPVLPYTFYEDIDSQIKNGNNNGGLNQQVEYTREIEALQQHTHTLKSQLASALYADNEAQQRIRAINVDTTKTRFEKVAELVEILKQLVPSNDTFQYTQIANDILNDNVENLLLNNVVVSDIFNPKQILTRDTERILLSIPDIQKWLSRHTL